MPSFQTSDRISLHYEDWGSGPALIFVASWGLDSRMWAPHMLHFNALGRRCIALDRRGHGRSDRPGHGYHYDRLADDLAELIAHLDLHDAILIAHSMGTGECTRYLSRHGSERIARAVYIGATAPCYLHSESYPQGLPAAAFEATSKALREDLPGWLRDNAEPFFLPAQTGVSDQVTRWTIDCVLDASLKALIDCFLARTQADMRQELRSLKLPMLLIHGDRDASEPGHGRLVAEHVTGSRYIEYAGAPHGLYHTHRAQVLADIECFIAQACHTAYDNRPSRAA
jgi:pimeloyl-ACP methyl ester carboxylesterase